MREITNKHSDEKEYLVPYLCDKKQNGGKESLLAEIVDFGIHNLEYSERDTLTDIFHATYTIDEYEQTLLNYYSQNSKDSEEIKEKTLFYLRTKKELEEKFLTLRGFILNSPDDQKDFVSYLCNKEENDNQKSLLAKIVDFGIDNLESSEQDTLKKILNETYTIYGA